MNTNTTTLAAPTSQGNTFIPLLSMILLSMSLAVGLPGNTFVVWSILKRMRKRSVTALMVLNLALADLAVLLTAPFFLYFLAQRTWSFKLAGCRLCHYICGVSMYASVLIITAMSLDRSLAVASPFLSQKMRTKVAARWLLAGIWVASFLLATPVLVFRTVVRMYKETVFCKAEYPSEKHRAFHLFFEAFTGFVVPFLVVVGSYSDISRRLQARRFHRSRRTGRLVVLIILAFAVFWLPYHVVNLVEGSRALAGTLAQSRQQLQNARYVCIALAFLSSSVNPLLYACAGGSLLRSAGLGFVAKMLEATGSEGLSTRRGGSLGRTVKNAPVPAETGPAESLDPLKQSESN
ncbi:leukotriene B4 receptor 1 [Fukomys damarensis]|nr:leukotriene B4 receptor 1 [Fukomys damarensis]